MNHTNIKSYIFWLLGGLLLGFLVIKAMGHSDFKVFLEAAQLLAARKNPYHVWIFVSEGNYDLYFNSPLWAMILIPFSYLPSFIPSFLWLLANTFFLYRIWKLLTQFIDFHSLSARQVNWLLFLSVMMCARFIVYNFEMIQMTIFLLWGVLESLSLFRNNKFLPGGALLALVINIKILPIVFIPYLLYRKEMKGAMNTLMFSVIYLFLPSLYLGWSANLFLLSEWWSVINPFNTEHLLESDLGLHSLSALIPSLLTKTDGVLPYARNIFNLDFETTANILHAVRAGLILFTLYFLGFPPFRKARSKMNEIRELSYLFLLIPLIFPHQQKYAFFMAFPAIFYICHGIIVHYSSRSRMLDKKYWAIIILSGISFMLMTLSTDGVIGRTLNQITQHYKTVTYGALILIIILVLCSPRWIEKKDYPS
jgi:hypothetical protein